MRGSYLARPSAQLPDVGLDENENDKFSVVNFMATSLAATGAAECMGSATARRPDRIRIPLQVHAAMRAELDDVGSPYEDIEGALLSVYPIFAQLPRQVLEKIRAFRNDPNSPGFLVVENCPIDSELPPTPSDGKRSTLKHGHISEACVLGLGQLLGEPLGYHNEKAGEIIQNLCPVESQSAQPSSESSEIPLGFHTDFDFDENDPCHPYNVTNADFIILLCLRPDPENRAFTLYADARDICAQLDRGTLALLRQPLFEFRTSYSFAQQTGVERIWSIPTQIIKGPQRYPEISIDMLCGVRGINGEADDALSALAKVCRTDKVAQRVCLQAGEGLLINNRKGAHARTAFPLSADGRNRWLQRVYARHSLWELRKDIDYKPRVY